MFVLDRSAAFELQQVIDVGDRWQEFAHARERTLGLILVPGETLVTPLAIASRSEQVWLRVLRGLPTISADGLELRLELLRPDAPARLVTAFSLDNDMAHAGLQEQTLSLPLRHGEQYQLRISCTPGPLGDSRADWLALAGFAAGAETALGRLRASSNLSWRLANEIAHFDSVYQSEFYRERQVDRSERSRAPIESLAPASGAPAAFHAVGLARRLQTLAPTAEENAFGYAHRLLASLLPMRPPDFVGRLRALAKTGGARPPRLLALCVGEAAVEGSLLAQFGEPAEVVILDVNETLLEVASRRMPDQVQVRRVRGNANEVDQQLGHFDVVCIVSGLHHLVDLEGVLAGIAKALRPGGEFWLIGEQVGRNGNRLWPEAYECANSLFRNWPEHKRRNGNSGQVDTDIPDDDFSSANFEGIRSEDIMGLLERYFLPADVYLRNAFLWRLFDGTYAANFDLGSEADLALIREAVVAEFLHWLEGGRGTELHGAFRSKYAEARA